MATDSRINGILASLAVKAPCVAVSVANLTLSGEQTVNGVAVVTDDRVLVAAQTAGKDNGIYDVKTTAWVRSADMDSNRDLVAGTLVVVATIPIVGFYQLTTTGTITLGTTALTFSVVANVNLAGDLASIANAKGASLVGVEDSAGQFTNADVEAVLAELGGVTGTFVATWDTGFTTVPTTTFNYMKVGKLVVIDVDAGFTATSNLTTFLSQAGDVPAIIRPATASQRMICPVEDNGSDVFGTLNINTAGTIQMNVGAGFGAFTASGAKGIPQIISLAYSLV